MSGAQSQATNMATTTRGGSICSSYTYTQCASHVLIGDDSETMALSICPRERNTRGDRDWFNGHRRRYTVCVTWRTRWHFLVNHSSAAHTARLRITWTATSRDIYAWCNIYGKICDETYENMQECTCDFVDQEHSRTTSTANFVPLGYFWPIQSERLVVFILRRINSF